MVVSVLKQTKATWVFQRYHLSCSRPCGEVYIDHYTDQIPITLCISLEMNLPSQFPRHQISHHMPILGLFIKDVKVRQRRRRRVEGHKKSETQQIKCHCELFAVSGVSWKD